MLPSEVVKFPTVIDGSTYVVAVTELFDVLESVEHVTDAVFVSTFPGVVGVILIVNVAVAMLANVPTLQEIVPDE
jgi:hypothetical protein